MVGLFSARLFGCVTFLANYGNSLANPLCRRDSRLNLKDLWFGMAKPIRVTVKAMLSV